MAQQPTFHPLPLARLQQKVRMWRWIFIGTQVLTWVLIGALWIIVWTR